MTDASMSIADRVAAALGDRYVVSREIGRGGMAVVYLAEDRKLNRPVAVKVLRTELSASLWRDRFVREIEIEAKLQHPNVVPVFESGEADGLLYYTMPYVEGESLRDRLRREGQIPLEDALKITKEVAEALSLAHSQGIVHRDIKPGNILLSSDHALVADFGIARAFAAAGAEALTKDTATFGTPTGVAVGTPEYMSPEQIAGDSTVDGRSDMYSLACVLFEMLAGDPPFTGRTSQSVINRQLQEPPPSLRFRRGKAPASVVFAVDKALCKIPADRFANMHSFVKALEASRIERKRVWWGAAGAVAVASVLGVVALATRGASPGLDPNHVVLFPLRAGAGFDNAGHEVASYMGYVLEGTDPLTWDEGRDWLPSEQRSNPALVTVDDALRLSRQRRAAYFIDGDVLRSVDSVTVILRLFDVELGQLVRRSGASGTLGASEPILGAQAMIDLLSAIVAPDRVIDKAALSLRDPGAVGNFLLGDGEYRASHFGVALRHFEQALGADSMFAFAAVMGAQAASWLENGAKADLLTRLALERDSLLPPRYALFAHGLAHYGAGRADSAVAAFRSALDLAPEWSEAWMALAEVYYHLLPDAYRLDSLAPDGFRKAREFDSTFAAPLYHLVEIALRSGQLHVADSLAQRFLATNPERSFQLQIQLMLRCMSEVVPVEEWLSLGQIDHTVVSEVAHSLSFVPGRGQCPEAAFHALLQLAPEAFGSDRGERAYRFAALFGLASLLVQQGRYSDASQLLLSPDALQRGGRYLLLLAAIEHDSLLADGAAFVEQRGEEYEAMGSSVLWLLGTWEARRGSPTRAARIASVLSGKAVSSGSRQDSIYAAIVSAHVALAQGDTLRALSRFRDLRPTGVKGDVGWSIWEGLGLERLTLARILVARGEYREALRVASAFDSTQPISFLLYRRQSLELRIQAADAIGDRVLADRLHRELEALQGDGEGA